MADKPADNPQFIYLGLSPYNPKGLGDIRAVMLGKREEVLIREEVKHGK